VFFLKPILRPAPALSSKVRSARQGRRFEKRESQKLPDPPKIIRSGFKTSDQFQGQGVPRIGNGAYMSVHEYFNPRDNTAIGPQMGF
jgi:hypothetical protein